MLGIVRWSSKFGHWNNRCPPRRQCVTRCALIDRFDSRPRGSLDVWIVDHATHCTAVFQHASLWEKLAKIGEDSRRGLVMLTRLRPKKPWIITQFIPRRSLIPIFERKHPSDIAVQSLGLTEDVFSTTKLLISCCVLATISCLLCFSNQVSSRATCYRTMSSYLSERKREGHLRPIAPLHFG